MTTCRKAMTGSDMNHETQRLLSAAGRGARVQYWDLTKGRWLQKPFLVPCSAELSRIHPEDAHLQYGPISTELRRIGDEWELNGGLVNWTDLTYVALNYPLFVYCMEEVHTLSYSNFDRSEYAVMPWLCAFAAELAADKGM